MKPVRHTDDFYRALTGTKPVVGVFLADWCEDCHFLEPHFEEIEEDFSVHLDFLTIDKEEHPAIFKNHRVDGIPSFILFDNGREIFRYVGPERKTKDQVVDFLKRGLALI